MTCFNQLFSFLRKLKVKSILQRILQSIKYLIAWRLGILCPTLHVIVTPLPVLVKKRLFRRLPTTFTAMTICSHIVGVNPGWHFFNFAWAYNCVVSWFLDIGMQNNSFVTHFRLNGAKSVCMYAKCVQNCGVIDNCDKLDLILILERIRNCYTTEN